MPAPRKYPNELRERSVRVVREAREQEPGLSVKSYGSHRPASGDRDELPVGEHRRLLPLHSGPRRVRLACELANCLVLAHFP